MPTVLRKIVQQAYLPCSGFQAACAGYCVWNPSAGHVPRGYYQCGPDSSVELIIVNAEPGDPAGDEVYNGAGQFFETSQKYFERYLVNDALRRNGKAAPFHRNLRKIISLFFDGENIELHLGKILFTNAVLCSAKVSGGRIPPEIEMYCGDKFLRKQISAHPNAFVLALGGKAQARLDRLGIEYNCGAQHPSARPSSSPAESWQEAASNFRNWRLNLQGRQDTNA